MLTVEKLRSRYGRIEVLHGISFEGWFWRNCLYSLAPTAPARQRFCDVFQGFISASSRIDNFSWRGYRKAPGSSKEFSEDWHKALKDGRFLPT
jgi:hypothetical protein